MLIYRNAGIPLDFRTGKPIPRAKERIEWLIEELDQHNEKILIATPVLSEVLTVLDLAEQAKMVHELESQSCFQISGFGKRAAIEAAIRTRKAILQGDKREGIESAWQKVKVDRQIVAIAAVEGASQIYSTDKDIHAHATLWGIQPQHISDIPAPAVQESLLEETPSEAETEAKKPGAQIGE
jgi:hypothetical protein